MTTANRSRLAFTIMVCVCLVLAVSAAATFRAKEMAEQEADILRDAIIKSDVAFVAINDHGQIKKWSSGAEKLFGWNRREAIGQHIDIIIPEDMRSAHESKFQEAVEDPDPKQVNEIECFALTKGGERVHVIATTRLYPGHEFTAVSVFELAENVNRVNALPK